MNLSVAVGKSDHALGPEDAPVTLVEYGDYQCPYCADMHPMIKSIAKSMGSQMRFVFRHMPLMEMHPYAQYAAEAAEAAAAQGKFWEMHDSIYQQQSELGSDLMHQLAVKLQLDIEQFLSDLDARRFRPRVKRDFMGGMRSGVAGTPAYFINGKRYEGPLDQASLQSAVGRA
ncbi:MAG TPA: thioredoxin domain-containing protein [Steroidobacteraceae bacterium]|jgi:protein-disulfide isomerase|nr:thioredoxin domain-containing protein [Steroidobacteraceae bacterium]